MGVEMFINLLILVVSVLLLLNGTTVLYLIAVLIATQAVSAVTCLLVLQRSQHPRPAPRTRRRHPARSLATQPLPSSPSPSSKSCSSAPTSSCSASSPDPAVTGIYSAAYNLVRILVKLIQSFWQALYPTLSRLHHETSPRYRTLSDLSLRYGLLALLPVAAITTGVAPDLIRLVYTEQYAASAPVLRWLIWTTPLYFVSTYAVTQLLVHRQATRGVGVIGVTLVAILILLPPLAARYGANGAAWASVLAAAVGALVGVLLPPRPRHPLPHRENGLAPRRRHGNRPDRNACCRCPGSSAVSLPRPPTSPVIWFSGALSTADANVLRRVLRPNAE